MIREVIRDVEVRQEGAGGDRWYRRTGSPSWHPSTTTALRVFWNPPEGAGAAIDFARQRGSEVHRACEYLARGMRVEELDLDEAVRPRVIQFDLWARRVGWHALFIEQPFVSETYGFGATPDQVGYFERSGAMALHVLELKPPDVQPTVGPQLSAQALAVRETLGLQYAPGRTALRLSDTTARELELQNHHKDLNLFLGALSWHAHLRNWRKL